MDKQEKKFGRKQPIDRPQPQQPQPRKLGEGLVREMMARGLSEVAYGIGLPSHDYGRTIHDRDR